MANKFVWMLVAILPAGALAQSAQPNYLDEMAKIDAQIAYVHKQAELREALKKSYGNEGLPKILSISIDDSGATAQVVYGTGLVRWLKKGDVLQDGIRVQSIDKSSVIAGGGRGKFRLAFFTPQPSAAGGAFEPVPAPPRLHIPLPQAPNVSPVASQQLASPASSTALPAAR